MNLTAHGKGLPGSKGLSGNRSLPAKILLIMRLTATFLLVATLHVSAAGFSQTVTISEKNAKLEDIFNILQQQTGYNFMFNSHMLAKAKRVTIQVHNATVEEVLPLCFKDQPFSYIIKDNTIIVKQKEEKKVVDPKGRAVAPCRRGCHYTEGIGERHRYG
jgi:type II secretory pathway component GspD/PulD (secretin)